MPYKKMGLQGFMEKYYLSTCTAYGPLTQRYDGTPAFSAKDVSAGSRWVCQLVLSTARSAPAPTVPTCVA